MQKIFLLTALLLFTLNVHSQNRNYEKALKSYNSSQWKPALKSIDKCLAEPGSKDNPAILILKSKIMYGISKDRKLSQKYPSAMKDAVKYAEKALEANPNESIAATFRNNNREYLSVLLKLNNREALEAYHQKKYAKALPLFRKSMVLAMDTQSLVLAADCYWQMGQRPESIPLFKKAAEMIYAAVLDSHSTVFGYHKEPFRKLCLYYMDHGAFDSAYIIVKNGREILPNDALLNEYTYSLMRHALEKIPPSEDYLFTVQNALKDFPADSFLNHRENSIFIYLLNGLAVNGDMAGFDSLMMRYARSKSAKKNLRQLERVRRYDIFAGQVPAVFLHTIRNYMAEIGLKEACYAAWLTENRMNGGSYLPTEKDGLRLLFQKEDNPAAAAYIFEQHLALHPEDKDFKLARTTYLDRVNAEVSGYRSLLPLIRLNDAAASGQTKNLSYANKAKALRMRLISEAADSGDFRLCRLIWKEASARYRDNAAALDLLWRKQVEADFRKNYYGSRIQTSGKKEAGIPEYTWNGSADSCLAGSMPLEVVIRAEQRINYFRRMAGLSEEVLLSNQDNEYCMFAALMCEANKSMSHEPGDGWRCFIPAGADALRDGILSRDGNPSIAVTAAMGQNHATAGNRRWLLYPRARYMGIGTSKTYTVIRAVDNSGPADTVKYKNQFVAWPPERECPRMLFFRKWSFSADLPMEGATVSMKGPSGEHVEVRQETPVNGYGMNTLVWEPVLNIQNTQPDSVFTVQIKLKNGRVFQYRVKLIDIAL